MAHQEQSRDGIPRKDQDRPSPARRPTGSGSPSAQDYRGDSPGKVGRASDAGRLGAPRPGMSDRNGPSDPDAKRSR